MKKQIVVRRIILAAVIVLAFVVGIIAGSGGGETTQAVPETKIETKTVEVVKTPRDCKVALDQADKLNDHAADLAEIAGDFIALIPEAATAGMNFDSASLDGITSTMDSLNNKLVALTDDFVATKGKYDEAKASCLAPTT